MAYDKDMQIALEALKLKSIGLWEKSAKETLDNIKDVMKLTKELAQSSSKQYNKVIASTFELLCNLLAGKPRTQWDRNMQEMHNGDSWAGVNGERNDGKHAKSFAAFLDCLEA